MHYLDVKRASTKLATGLVMKLQISSVLVETSAFPLDVIVPRARCSDESGEEIGGAVEGIENRPRDLLGKKWKQVARVKRRFQRFGG